MVDKEKLLTVFGATYLTSFLGAVLTQGAVSGWYTTISKPFFTPPNWVFGPVWLILYTMMAFSAYLVWEEDHKRSMRAVKIYFLHLALNLGWSIGFFTLKSPLLGILIILPLLGLIIYMAYYFKDISRKASYLLLPYIIWVAYATALNIAIYLMN